MTSKCDACGKTVYPMEKVSSGQGTTYHKFCFKCEQCKVVLNLSNVQTKNGKLWCPQHVPKEVATQTADRHDLNTIKTAPKIETVNQQVRGELAGQASREGTDSIGIGGRITAPKVSTVNEQFRGELVGQKTNITTDSIAIGSKLNAPKLDTVNQQVRGELAGQQTHITSDALGIADRVHAPKLDTVNQQVRGELAGAQPHLSLDAVGIAHGVNAPKVEQHLGIKRGDSNVELAKGEVYHAY